MRAARLSKTHAYEMYAMWELHACEIAYGRGTHMRDAPVRWPMRDARLWDGFCEMHAYERCPYEMAADERRAEGHPYEMAPVRNMPMRDAPMRHAPVRDMPMRWPMEETRL
jgi:hypothetical protein